MRFSHSPPLKKKKKDCFASVIVNGLSYEHIATSNMVTILV